MPPWAGAFWEGALLSGSSFCVLSGLLACALSQFLPRLYIGPGFLWYSFFFLVWRVSICDHLGYISGTVLVYSYALTGPAALYARLVTRDAEKKV